MSCSQRMETDVVWIELSLHFVHSLSPKRMKTAVFVLYQQFRNKTRNYTIICFIDSGGYWLIKNTPANSKQDQVIRLYKKSIGSLGGNFFEHRKISGLIAVFRMISLSSFRCKDENKELPSKRFSASEKFTIGTFMEKIQPVVLMEKIWITDKF